MLKALNNIKISTYSTAGRNSLFFVPGLFLVLIGLAALVAPKLFIAVIATFFVFTGSLLLFCAVKLVALRRKFSKFFERGFVISNVQLGHPVQTEEADEKKILYH